MRSVLPRRPVAALLFAITAVLFVVGGLLPGEFKEVIRRSLSLGNLDVYAHLVFCALVGFFAFLAGLRWWWIMLFVMGLGGLVEVVQVWLPGRSPSWADMLDNGLGVAAGMFLAWLLLMQKQKVTNG